MGSSSGQDGHVQLGGARPGCSEAGQEVNRRKAGCGPAAWEGRVYAAGVGGAGAVLEPQLLGSHVL